MEKINLSVVIPVSKDLKIRECLQSIDAIVEVVVVLNNYPSPEVVKIVENDKRCNPVYLEGPGCNLAQVFNIGISLATYEKVVLTNSDCLFTPGLLNKLCLKLDEYEIVKAQVDFSFEGHRQMLVSECRRLFHQVFDDGTKLFGPGLSFKKTISQKIGGYFFDELVEWGEDGELSIRLHKANLKFFILDEKIKHGGESIVHDLKVAFKIGKGNGAKDKQKKLRVLSALLDDIHSLITDRKGRFKTAYQEGGWHLLLYFLLWKVVLHLGYYIKRMERV
ncbi:MAG TPA: glycosyltransferase family A protein [Candidatus Saccharimonadales bacterium]|nr:glycosyltransferase family A protein [Candidatus Saccharimonadales bacterium]